MVGLDFGGKGVIHSHHMTVPIRPLIPDVHKSLNSTDNDNLIIHGDNLHALKALLPRYAGKVNCIYIDPPYNTGNEGWVYNDNVNSPMMQRWLDNAKEVDGEDLERHDKWLCMMWPRLQLLKELLADDGVIFVSIDDNEQVHLQMVLDEIFGEENHIATIVVNSNPGGRDYGGIARTHDYVLAYGREINSELNMIPVADAVLPMHDEEGGFELRELRNRNKKFNDKNRPNLFYPFYVDTKHTDTNGMHPVSINPKRGWTKTYPEKTEEVQTVWRWSREKVQKNANNVVARKKRSGKFGIWEKFRRTGKRQRSIFYDTKYRTESGTLLLKEIFGSTVFPYPKSLDLVKDLLVVGTRTDSIVLDSTAGSGTTAHAVLELNKYDGGNRKFILVECEDYADTTTAERVRRIINGIPGAKSHALREGTGGSFVYCTLGDPLDINNILVGKDLPDYSVLASHLLYTATGISISKKREPKNEDGLFHTMHGTDYYLLYRPDIEYLRSNKAVLDGVMVERIRKRGKKAVVFGGAKYMGQKELTQYNIQFCSIPELLRR